MTHDEIYKAEKRKDNYSKMTHEHDFVKDLDGQVTCSICGTMDDEQELR